MSTKRRYTRLSKSEWDSIVSLYNTGAAPLADLSAKYAVAVSSIMNQAKARGLTRRASFPATAGLKAAAAGGVSLSTTGASRLAIIPAQTTEERIRSTNDDVYSDAIAIQHMIRLAVAALPQPSSPQEATATIRATDMAITALDRCNRIRRTVLRLDRENLGADVVLPELPTTEMTAIEVEAMRAEQAREDCVVGVETPGDAFCLACDELEDSENEVVEIA